MEYVGEIKNALAGVGISTETVGTDIVTTLASLASKQTVLQPQSAPVAAPQPVLDPQATLSSNLHTIHRLLWKVVRPKTDFFLNRKGVPT